MSESDYYPDKNVSKVIGIATLLVVTVLLAALIGSVFLGLDFGLFDRGNEVNQAAFDIEETDDSLLIEPLAVNEGNEIAVVRGSTSETVMTIDAEDVGNIINLAKENDITLKKGEMINLVNLVTGELVAQHEVSSNIGNEDNEEEPDGTVSTSKTEFDFTTPVTTRGVSASGSLEQSKVNIPSEYYDISSYHSSETYPISSDNYVEVRNTVIKYKSTTGDLKNDYYAEDSSLGEFTMSSMSGNTLVVSDSVGFEVLQISSINKEYSSDLGSIRDVYVNSNENVRILTDNYIYVFDSSFNSDKLTHNGFDTIVGESSNNILALGGKKLYNYNKNDGSKTLISESVLKASYDGGDLAVFREGGDNRIEKLDPETGEKIGVTRYAYHNQKEERDFEVENGRIYYVADIARSHLWELYPNDMIKAIKGEHPKIDWVKNITGDSDSALGSYTTVIGEDFEDPGDRFQQPSLSSYNDEISVNNGYTIVQNDIMFNNNNIVEGYRPIGGFGYMKENINGVDLSDSNLMDMIELQKNNVNSSNVYKNVLKTNTTIKVTSVEFDGKVKGPEDTVAIASMGVARLSQGEGIFGDNAKLIPYGRQPDENVTITNGEYTEKELEDMLDQELDWEWGPGNYTLFGIIGASNQQDGSIGYQEVATVSLNSMVINYKEVSSNESGKITLGFNKNALGDTRSGSVSYDPGLIVDLNSKYEGNRSAIIHDKETFSLDITGGEGDYSVSWDNTRQADKKPDSKTRVFDYTQYDKGEFTVKATVVDGNGTSETVSETFTVTNENYDLISASKYSLNAPDLDYLYPGETISLTGNVDNTESTNKKSYKIRTVIGGLETNYTSTVDPESIENFEVDVDVPEDKIGNVEGKTYLSEQNVGSNTIMITHLDMSNTPQLSSVAPGKTKTLELPVKNPTDTQDTIEYKFKFVNEDISSQDTITVGPDNESSATIQFTAPEQTGKYDIELVENGKTLIQGSISVEKYDMLSSSNYDIDSSNIGQEQIHPGNNFDIPVLINNPNSEPRSYFVEFGIGDNPDSAKGTIQGGQSKEVTLNVDLPSDTGMYSLTQSFGDRTQENQIPIAHANVQSMDTSDKTVDVNSDSVSLDIPITNPSDTQHEVSYTGSLNGQTTSETVTVSPGSSEKVTITLPTPSETGTYTLSLQENGNPIGKIDVNVQDGPNFNINSMDFYQEENGQLTVSIENAGLDGSEQVTITGSGPGWDNKEIYNNSISIDGSQYEYIQKTISVTESGSYDITVNTESDTRTETFEMTASDSLSVTTDKDLYSTTEEINVEYSITSTQTGTFEYYIDSSFEGTSDTITFESPGTKTITRTYGPTTDTGRKSVDLIIEELGLSDGKSFDVLENDVSASVNSANTNDGLNLDLTLSSLESGQYEYNVNVGNGVKTTSNTVEFNQPDKRTESVSFENIESGTYDIVVSSPSLGETSLNSVQVEQVQEKTLTISQWSNYPYENRNFELQENNFVQTEPTEPVVLSVSFSDNTEFSSYSELVVYGKASDTLSITFETTDGRYGKQIEGISDGKTKIDLSNEYLSGSVRNIYLESEGNTEEQTVLDKIEFKGFG